MNYDGMITADMMGSTATMAASFGVSMVIKISDGDGEFRESSSREAQRLRLLGVLYCEQFTYTTRSIRKKHQRNTGKLPKTRIASLVLLAQTIHFHLPTNECGHAIGLDTSSHCLLTLEQKIDSLPRSYPTHSQYLVASQASREPPTAAKWVGLVDKVFAQSITIHRPEPSYILISLPKRLSAQTSLNASSIPSSPRMETMQLYFFSPLSSLLS